MSPSPIKRDNVDLKKLITGTGLLWSRLECLETYHSVCFLGTGADFFQQLKLDFSRHFSESI